MKLELCDGYRWEALPDGCLLYHESSGKVVTLNEAAELVLMHCDGEHTEDELCQLLVEETELTPSACHQALADLKKEGIVSCLPD